MGDASIQQPLSLGKRYRVGASSEFVEDHPWSEAKLFAQLDEFKLAKVFEEVGVEKFPIITNEGLKMLARGER